MIGSLFMVSITFSVPRLFNVEVALAVSSSSTSYKSASPFMISMSSLRSLWPVDSVEHKILKEAADSELV